MKRPARVLVISHLPPAHGGIATWGRILRDHSPNEACRFLFESISGMRTDDSGSAILKSGEAARLVAHLIRHLSRDRPDVIHLNCCMSPLGMWRDLLVSALARLARVPLVVHYHGSLPDVLPRLPSESRFAMRRLMNAATVNIGVTRESKCLLSRQCPHKAAAYLPNFIEDEWLRWAGTPASGSGRGEGRMQAVYAGRLSRAKGTLDLLRAARELPHVDFVLMGDILDEAKDAVDAAPANVTAMGHVSRLQVMERLFGSDVFVFPSHREGFPIAVLEAMATGLPVVATRVGGVVEMIEEGRGGNLVSPGDDRALARAIGRLDADRDLARRMGAHNRHLCLERFTFSAVFRSLSAIYDRFNPERTGLEASGVDLAGPPEEDTTPFASAFKEANQ